MIEYQSCILSRNEKRALELLPLLTNVQRNKIARFLEEKLMYEEAASLSNDPEHLFELAEKRGDLEDMIKYAGSLGGDDRWRKAASLALIQWDFPHYETCLQNGHDYPGLFSYYESTGDFNGMSKLALTSRIHSSLLPLSFLHTR